ncbi:hypothetical protein PYW07_009201 [Mythimna separata]|uniref:Transposable element P transposase-like GTP-binding insertion domain-containing protein n=1 Tax=Mythimna separata TaxID=271217 RepID=A0AAD8DN24_MYTSE|nr:hypothetical protein PYW07_009201 [Mythimna separata]
MTIMASPKPYASVSEESSDVQVLDSNEPLVTVSSSVPVSSARVLDSIEPLVPTARVQVGSVNTDHDYLRKRRHVDHTYCKPEVVEKHSETDIVANAVGNTGLKPLALVCDQGTAFQAALKSLQEDTRRLQIIAGENIDGVIVINGQKLSVIHDPPHLIKGLRNNFLTKNISLNGQISKWNDIVDVYKTDCNHAQSRLLHKLTDEHVIPEKIKKMKVKNCTTVFSKTVAATLSYTAQFSHYADGTQVSSTLKNTAKVVSFFDDLFDSVNGTGFNKTSKGKPLRQAVTENSQHHEFWREAIKKLEQLKFVDKHGKETSNKLTQNHFTVTQVYHLRILSWFVYLSPLSYQPGLKLKAFKALQGKKDFTHIHVRLQLAVDEPVAGPSGLAAGSCGSLPAISEDEDEEDDDVPALPRPTGSSGRRMNPNSDELSTFIQRLELSTAGASSFGASTYSFGYTEHEVSEGAYG